MEAIEGGAVPLGRVSRFCDDGILRVGDAGAVRVIVNGRDRGSIGRDGQVQTVRFAVGEP